MARKKRTALSVKQLKVRGFYADPEAKNLYVQVSKLGTKNYVFRFKSPITGKARWMGLGGLNEVSLAKAREFAANAREVVKAGLDPLIEKDATLAARREAYAREMASKMSFEECCTQYLATHLDQFRNDKHKAQWQASLTRACRAFGNVPVSDIGVDMVVKFLGPIWQATPESASRIRGRVERVLDWASARGFRTGDNPARWRGHLEHLLQARPKAEHHASLEYAELPAFMAELRERQSLSARAVEFTILTAARTGEVIGARWDEIKDGVWTIPGSRMKAGKQHRVPLSRRALEILDAMPCDGGLIFPLSNMAMLSLVKGMDGGKLTMHGFRSTFSTWAREMTAYQRDVVEMALAHTIKDKSERAYQRGDMLAKRSKLMQSWSDYCGSTPVEASVVSIGKARA